MTFNEWFAKLKIPAGNTVEVAHDVAKSAWIAALNEAELVCRNKASDYRKMADEKFMKHLVDAFASEYKSQAADGLGDVFHLMAEIVK